MKLTSNIVKLYYKNVECNQNFQPKSPDSYDCILKTFIPNSYSLLLNAICFPFLPSFLSFSFYDFSPPIKFLSHVSYISFTPLFILLCLPYLPISIILANLFLFPFSLSSDSTLSLFLHRGFVYLHLITFLPRTSCLKDLNT
jgi:hypothetical protein